MIRDTSGQDQLLAPSVGRSWRRWTSAGVVSIALVLGLAYVVRGWLGAEHVIDRSRIRIARVERGTLVRDVVADGRVVAANSPLLYAVAAGTVELRVQAGDTVHKGQVLATIDSPELKSRLFQERATLAGLEAGAGKAQLDVEQGRANARKLIEQAEVDRAGAARELDINREMEKSGVISKLEMLRSEDALRKAEIALLHARTQATLSGKQLAFEVGTHQQTLDRQREVVRELERQVAALDLASPVDGQVGQLVVAQRAAVTANAPVLSVVDLGAFELEIRVPDSFARDLALGMTAEIKAGAVTYPARVRSVSPEVIDGNVATRLQFSGERPVGLRQNQRLGARILIEQRANVLKVERGSFLEHGGGTSAYFVRDGLAEKRPIRTGALGLDAVEIVTGAAVGDQIVVTGADAFGTSERVRIAD